MRIHWHHGTDDIAAVFAPTPDWDFELIQLNAGLLGYQSCLVELPDVIIRYETLDKPIRSFQQMNKTGFCAGVVLTADQPVLWKGQEVTYDTTLVFGQALLAKGPSSIADAALGAGFQHFGRAAQYYRQQFGELPKQTLKRP